ncbi:hypothetical protein ACLK19_00655 [Escherichia coli]
MDGPAHDCSFAENFPLVRWSRNDGPESHFGKRGTPTMGGIMILTAIVISVLCGLTRPIRTSGACWWCW